MGRKGMLVVMKNVRAQCFNLATNIPSVNRGVKFRVLEMVINGSGVRDISRVLHISADVVIDTLKKRKQEPAGKSELY